MVAGLEVVLSAVVEVGVSVLTGVELESEVAVDSTDEVVESPVKRVLVKLDTILEMKPASVEEEVTAEVVESVDSVTDAPVNVADESVDEVEPVELDSDDVAVSVDAAESEVVEAVS